MFCSTNNSLEILSPRASDKDTLSHVDVIIWGTGFKMQGWGTAFKIVGQHGKTLGEHWGGAPRTLYGMLYVTIYSWPSVWSDIAA
jgi:hypothetical protein